MILIIGLGNPGDKYENNRHNLGFMVVDDIAEKKGVVFRLEHMYESRYAEMGEIDERIKLVKPDTFMNESGRAVEKTKNYWKVDSEDIWVIHDDVDLELGKVKVQLGGSSAGHRGVQSVIDHVGEQFWRIRVGIGRHDQIPTDAWVLKDFTSEENIGKIIDTVSNNVLEFINKEIKEEVIIIN